VVIIYEPVSHSPSICSGWVSQSPPPVCSSCVSSLHRTGARLLHSMPLRHVCSPAGLVTLPHLRNQAYLHAHIDICGGLGVKGKAVPLQALSGPEGSRKLGFPDYMTRAQDGGKVGGLTRRPPLPPRKCSWYSFLLEAESTPGPEFDRKDYVNKKFQWHQLGSNQRPSSL
jgi:hypothetical protein